MNLDQTSQQISAPKNNPIDLQALANLHLDNVPSSSIVFQIPSLFGKEKSQNVIKVIPEEKPDIIDLSAALKATPLRSGPKPKTASEEIVRKPCDIELLIPKDFWVKEFEKVNTKQASNLGKVICRRWISNHRQQQKLPLKYQKSAHEYKIQTFKFDTPSPDAIVREAQKKAFGNSN